MLVPALYYKDEILKKFAKEMYSESYFYYMGYRHGHQLPKVDESDFNYRWAIVDEDKVIGYFAYRVNVDYGNSVTSFGLYSFRDEDKNISRATVRLIEDVYNKMFELFSQYRRVSWCVVSGNPVERTYDRLLEEAAELGYETYKHTSHDCCKDNQGNYHDSIEYEVINKKKG